MHAKTRLPPLAGMYASTKEPPPPPCCRLEGLDLAALQFSTLLVDPPRAGLDPQTVQLLREFDRVVYISCNPGACRRSPARPAGRACGIASMCTRARVWEVDVGGDATNTLPACPAF